MEENDVDRWIKLLGSDFDTALGELLKLGEPALRRLFQESEGLVSVPTGKWIIDAINNRQMALGCLGKFYPDVFLELVRGRKYLKFSTIYAIGLTGDQKLQAIAKEALKFLGDDLGTNYPMLT